MGTTLVKKLQLKPEQHMQVRNAPEGYFEQLNAALGGLAVLEAEGAPGDALFLFVHSLAEVKGVAVETARNADPECLLWIAYPKARGKFKPDINRDSLWQAMKPSGWRPVRQVALDDAWSAMRFRPADRVGS